MQNYPVVSPCARGAPAIGKDTWLVTRLCEASDEGTVSGAGWELLCEWLLYRDWELCLCLEFWWWLRWESNEDLEGVLCLWEPFPWRPPLWSGVTGWLSPCALCRLLPEWCDELLRWLELVFVTFTCKKKRHFLYVTEKRQGFLGIFYFWLAS